MTQDVDFVNLVALYGPPPKVIWIRCRNQSNQYLERLVRMHYEDIVGFEHAPELDCLELYPFDSLIKKQCILPVFTMRSDLMPT